MTRNLETRIRALEARRAAQGATTGAQLWLLADWKTRAEARRALSPEAWLDAMLRDELMCWPVEKRESMALQWRQTAKLERMIADGFFGEGA